MGKEARIEYKIDWQTVSNIIGFDAEYDKKSDTLLIQCKEARPAVAMDCGGEFWVRVDPATGEILGVEIENFQSFKKAHRDVFKRESSYLRPVADVIQQLKCPAYT